MSDYVSLDPRNLMFVVQVGQAEIARGSLFQLMKDKNEMVTLFRTFLPTGIEDAPGMELAFRIEWEDAEIKPVYDLSRELGD